MPEKRPVTILVVDDNQAKRYAVCRVLRQAGFEILEATSGEEGLCMMASRPELVVLDVKLPGMSGYDVCRRIKNDPEHASVKVLHVSATFVDTAHKVEGLVGGADGYLVQPVEPLELVETVRALLRLREAEEAARATACEWRGTFDAIANGILLLDASGGVLRCNKAACDLMGRSDVEMVGCTYTEVCDCFGSDQLPQLSRLQETLERQSLEVEVGDRYFLVTADPVTYEPAKGIGAVYVFTDVTERRRAEQALTDANRAKDEFLAMLSHELRNPLSAVANAAALIRMKAVRKEVKFHAGVLEHQVEQMARLVDDLLDVSRITRGKIELRREPVPLATVIRDAVDTVRSFADAKNHELKVHLPREPLTVEGDAARLEQVVGNVLNNALKYTEPGGQIEVELSRQGSQALIRVIDNGIGIPPETLPSVFDLFRQGKRGLDRAQGGLGIGLTVVKQMLEMHGGTVEVESNGTGHGTEVLIRLPLMDRVGRAIPHSRPEPEASGGNLRVLVVDDIEDAAEMMKEIIASWGHEASIAFDGMTALEKIRAERPDVVLMDLGLPHLDGLEVARRVRSDADLDSVILVAVTGYGADDDRIRTQDAGFTHHLTKPVSLPHLHRLLSHIRS